MNVLSVFTASALGLALSASVQASTTFDEAPVLSSTPVYHLIETRAPRQECWEEDVVHEVRNDRNRSATPGLVGALIGGALGNAVGNHKSNKRVGTVVGAILGGSLASDISRARRSDGDDYYVETRERCRTTYTNIQEEKLVGYDVSYSYNGSRHTVRMPEDPGASVRVRVDVEPVL